MALIESINSAINGFVWGVPMLVLVLNDPHHADGIGAVDGAHQPEGAGSGG